MHSSAKANNIFNLMTPFNDLINNISHDFIDKNKELNELEKNIYILFYPNSSNFELTTTPQPLSHKENNYILAHIQHNQFFSNPKDEWNYTISRHTMSSTTANEMGFHLRRIANAVGQAIKHTSEPSQEKPSLYFLKVADINKTQTVSEINPPRLPEKENSLQSLDSSLKNPHTTSTPSLQPFREEQKTKKIARFSTEEVPDKLTKNLVTFINENKTLAGLENKIYGAFYPTTDTFDLGTTLTNIFPLKDDSYILFRIKYNPNTSPNEVWSYEITEENTQYSTQSRNTQVHLCLQEIAETLGRVIKSNHAPEYLNPHEEKAMVASPPPIAVLPQVSREKEHSILTQRLEAYIDDRLALAERGVQGSQETFESRFVLRLAALESEARAREETLLQRMAALERGSKEREQALLARIATLESQLKHQQNMQSSTPATTSKLFRS